MQDLLAKAEDQRKLAVWNKGAVIQNYAAADWRRDVLGNAISFAAYGDRTSEHGWEIDHILPASGRRRRTRHHRQPPAPPLGGQRRARVAGSR